MRGVKAFIREKRANEVMQTLRTEGFASLTVPEAEGMGKYTKKKIPLPLGFLLPIAKCPSLKSYARRKMCQGLFR